MRSPDSVRHTRRLRLLHHHRRRTGRPPQRRKLIQAWRLADLPFFVELSPFCAPGARNRRENTDRQLQPRFDWEEQFPVEIAP